MTPFATIAQYDARFPGRTAPDETLDECLADASEAIALALEKAGVDWQNPSDDLARRMMRTCRSVAKRIMPSDLDVPVGVTQMSVTAGPYQQTYSMPSAYGLPKLLDSELSMLGIGGSRFGWAPMGGHDD